MRCPDSTLFTRWTQTGHGWDVKSIDWHPTKSLLVSGGKDNLVKLWDAKTGKELCSLHGHKNMVLSVKWNQNGNWVLTASKDQIIKLYDIRSMKELESFRGHRKDVTALAWHPFHEEYFVSGSYDGSIFHWLVGHETPQVEIPGAHDGSVWDLAWHPIGYLLCSGSNDHTTKFWCRNRPGDTGRDRYTAGYNQGYVEQNPHFSGRMVTGFQVPEAPPTPGPFAPGLSRNEGTIPGIGVAMPLSALDGSDQGDQRQAIPGILPSGAPPLPPGPHPSLIASGQQQVYQQFQPQQQQQQQQQPLSFPQQMAQMPLPPPNLNQLQPQQHLSLFSHPHLPRPPSGPASQVQQLGMPAPLPSSMPGSMSMPSTMAPMALQNPLTMQGSGNQMISSLPQGHMMGLNQMHSGPPNAGTIPPNIGNFPNGLANIQGTTGAGAQNFPMGGMFNRPQVGQLSQIPGLNTFQPGMMDGRGAGMGMGGGNIGLPPPPPLPQGSAPQ